MRAPWQRRALGISWQNIALGSRLFNDLRAGHRSSLFGGKTSSSRFFLLLVANAFISSFKSYSLLPSFFFLFSFLPFPSNTRVLLRSRERSLTRAFYVRRARFSAVIDTTSVESTQTDRINSVGRFQFNAKRGPRAIS